MSARKERVAALTSEADRFFRKLMKSPVDDEPLTAEQEARMARGEREIDRGDYVTLEELQDGLG